MCFNHNAKKELKEKNVAEADITNFGTSSICIDASGPDSNPDMKVAGKNNATFLVIRLSEKDERSAKEVPVIALKTESYSAVGVEKLGYGVLQDRIYDNIMHMVKWVQKKGPIEYFRTKSNVNQKFPDLKEDKLDKKITNLLPQIKMNEGKKEGTEQEKKLYDSYQQLKKTMQFGSDPSLSALENHLTLMIPYMEKGELDAANKILGLINEKKAAALNTSAGWRHQLLPRSEEVILPTLREMIEDKITFQAKN